MPRPVIPERYDAETAAAMTQLGDGLEGLPAYLGIRTTHMGPATMTAQLEVRADLLNPFGTLHGGVISALVDHVLGAVLYPVIEHGRWAATTEFKVNLLAAVREGSVEGAPIARGVADGVRGAVFYGRTVRRGVAGAVRGAVGRRGRRLAARRQKRQEHQEPGTHRRLRAARHKAPRCFMETPAGQPCQRIRRGCEAIAQGDAFRRIEDVPSR